MVENPAYKIKSSNILYINPFPRLKKIGSRGYFLGLYGIKA